MHGRVVLDRMEVELLSHQDWKTKIELATAIHDYIRVIPQQPATIQLAE
jgi:hypothetical protein